MTFRILFFLLIAHVTGFAQGRLNYLRMVKGEASGVYRSLAYAFTNALGIPNEFYKGSLFDIAAKSVFVLDNADNQSQGTCFHLADIGIVTNHHVVPNVSSLTGITPNNCEISNTTGVEKYRCVKFLKSSEELDIAIIDPDLHALTMPKAPSTETVGRC